jgi:hypothetical protein
MPVITALGRLRQVDQEFKPSLDMIAILCLKRKRFKTQCLTYKVDPKTSFWVQVIYSNYYLIKADFLLDTKGALLPAFQKQEL